MSGAHPKAGVIFDLDGTLADTLDDITASLNHALDQVGASGHPPHVVAGMIGDGACMLVQRALGDGNIEPLDEVIAHFAEHYRQHALDRTQLYEGIAEQLDQFIAWGWKLAVLSNKPHEFTVQCCHGLLGRWRFEAIRGADGRTPKKPDPTAALRIAEQMSLPPGRIYFVGDMPNDILTGRRAGMVTAAVAWGFADVASLADLTPDILQACPEGLAGALRAHHLSATGSVASSPD